jgi:oligopeptidase A
MSKLNPLTIRTSQIPFNMLSADHIADAVETLLARAARELEQIKSVEGSRTFDNTMIALDNLGLDLDFAMGIISHLESVATTPAWREAYNTVLPKVTEFRSKIILDNELWRALCDYSKSSEAASLPAHRRRFLTKTIDAFKRGGAELSQENKEILAALNTELANLTNSFSQNTLDATNEFEFTTEDIALLSGLPESALLLGKAGASAKSLPGWRFTLQAPSLIAILTYADDRQLRERFYRAFNSRCSEGKLNNRDTLYRILELRKKKATILGYQDFSDLVLADRMAKDGETAVKFVKQLRNHVEPHFLRDSDELKRFVRDSIGMDPNSLQPWDIAYYVEKMRKARYDFDEEALRPYFPLPRVLAGLFSLVEKVFGISVSAHPSLPTWDPHVTAYSVRDTDSGSLIGYFYSDLFPRENKRGGAWMNSLITHTPRDGDHTPHVGLIAGNFTPPSGDTPALLTHDEVTTLFHEFGHLLHLLCNATELRSQSMSDVAWDFIELPSQILENWCWEKESLSMVAGHYQTGEAIPESLFAKMLKARNYRSASHIMRQLGFSTIDLMLHRMYDPARDGDVVEYARDILAPFSPLPLPSDYAMILTFTHLFSSPVGYAAGYYSYQWAEVLDADAFTRFQGEGLCNPTTGRDFRDMILSRGDSQDPTTLFEHFMGRPADMNALLERSGLVSNQS